MNKKEYPNFADKFTIVVWSDSSPERIVVELVETGVYSGIFTGKIFVSDSQSEGKKLFANPGDFIYALYIDSTIPQANESSEIIAATVVKIRGEDMSKHFEGIDPSMRTNQQTLVPDWVKSNAGWWADGTISDGEFLSGIQFLIKDGIITIPPTVVSSETSDNVPDWVKSNAGWWADGTISDGEFLNGIQHLIKIGIVNVPGSDDSPSQQESTMSSNSELVTLQAELDNCAEINKAYDRLNCERAAKHKITAYKIKSDSQVFEVGPVTYYWPGLDTDGNTFEITSSGQALLNLRILVENTDSEKNEAFFCTGPAVCNYDITNGDKVYKYAQMDFTNGQVVLKPGEAKIFNMMFGPNIGGGGTTFEHDSGKDYHFRINKSYGSGSIPLNLG